MGISCPQPTVEEFKLMDKVSPEPFAVPVLLLSVQVNVSVVVKEGPIAAPPFIKTPTDLPVDDPNVFVVWVFSV